MKFVKGGTATPDPSNNQIVKHLNSRSIGDYYINASALNVRSGEGTDYRIIGALPQGQKVQVISENLDGAKLTITVKLVTSEHVSYLKHQLVAQ